MKVGLKIRDLILGQVGESIGLKLYWAIRPEE